MALALLIAHVSVRHPVITRFTSPNKRAIDRSNAVRLVAKNLGTTDFLQINIHDRILGLYSGYVIPRNNPLFRDM
ncbi:MAG TPA: hypothetical protein VE566_01765 [Nitrososphaeraceae archaeon]|nr:hypothetical protein [Nitrososphaeraceae archaeon]